MATGQSPKVKKKMTAAPFPYPENMEEVGKKKFREEKLQNNQDKLYYDERKNGQISNLIFETQNYEGWREAVKDAFPDLEETEVKWFKLKDTEGTVHVYPTGRIVVYGQMIDQFDEKFEQMKKKAKKAKGGKAAETAEAIKQMENLKLNERRGPEE